MNKSFKYNTISVLSPASVAADYGLTPFNLLPHSTPNHLKINSFCAFSSNPILRIGVNSCGKNVVKAIPTAFDDGFCDISYFSRAPIPYMDNFLANMAFKHIGVYGFTATTFEEIRNLVYTELEESERLEQLRWLQNHIVISATI